MDLTKINGGYSPSHFVTDGDYAFFIEGFTSDNINDWSLRIARLTEQGRPDMRTKCPFWEVRDEAFRSRYNWIMQTGGIYAMELLLGNTQRACQGMRTLGRSMKYDIRLTFPMMVEDLPAIEARFAELKTMSGDRRKQTNLVITEIVREYPMGIDINNKMIIGVDRTSFDRALVVVEVKEVGFEERHINQLLSPLYTITLTSWAVANHHWSIELKRFT